MARTVISSEMERILRDDPHVQDILYDNLGEIPEIDPSHWSGERYGKVKDVLEQVVDFLLAPYIVDDFKTNHDQRRTWQDALVSRHSELEQVFEQNPIRRRGFLMMPVYVQEFSRGYTGPNIEMLQELQDAVFEGFPDSKYGSLSTEDKIEAIKEVKRRTYNILVFLSKQNPASST